MTGEPTKGSIRVLLADDDEGFVASLRALIEGQPELTVVGSARNGIEAIDLAAALGPDAAVIDLHMPVLDGTAAIGRLRQDHPTLRLIALTGDDDSALHQAARSAGANAVIHKRELVALLLQRLRGTADV